MTQLREKGATSKQHILDILDKQRLVASVVHGQSMQRRELVETLLHRQQRAELAAVLGRSGTSELAEVLVELEAEQASTLWSALSPAQREAVIFELPRDMAVKLAAAEDDTATGSRIMAFELIGGKLVSRQLRLNEPVNRLNPVWIDLLNTSRFERAYIGKLFDLELPDQTQAGDLEVSSRFQIDDSGSIQLHSNFLLDRDGHSRSVPVTFLVHRGILFSIRDAELAVFRLQRYRATRATGTALDCLDILLELYGTDIEYSADSLEDAYGNLNVIGQKVLSGSVTDEDASSILSDIAEEEDLNSRIRGNILDTDRAITFLIRCKVLSPDHFDDARQIKRNIESLNSHTAFLFDKINFLMDATIGLINVNQNRRVSQLTIFGVIFMPLNMLASVGGMSEFSMMTAGVAWEVSYGLALIVMGVIAVATYFGLRAWERRKKRSATRYRRLRRDG